MSGGERAGPRLELTASAIAALRALPREARAEIAARIDHLAAEGLPPALSGLAEGGQALRLPVGDLELICVHDIERERVVVVAIRPVEPDAAATVVGLAKHTLPRWAAALTGGVVMGSFLQDVRHAVRSLLRSPGFSIASVLTLALGIGATAAVFSVANGVLLRPLPYGDAERVVTIWSSWVNFPDRTWVSFAEYRHYHAESTTLEDLALYQTGTINFTEVSAPEQVGAAAMTANTLSVLGVQPMVGRGFTEEEAIAADPAGPLVITADLWQRRYDRDPSIVGGQVEIDGVMRPVVGVLPAGFALPVDYGRPGAAEVFFPLYVDLTPGQNFPVGGGSHGSYVAARLREGETPSSALADLERTLDPLRADGTYPADRNFHPRVYGVKDDIVGSARATILVLFGAVGFVLLIACGNVANLQLSRSEVRLREVAIRTALGAGRSRVVRQLLTESAVMAVVAGTLGLAMGFAGIQALLAIDPEAVPRASSIRLDGRVLSFTFAVSIGTALVFGSIPALRATRAGLAESLREAGRSGARGVRSGRVQGLLVASQMAMAVVLLTGSMLMIRTFVSLTSIDPGFRSDRILTLSVSAPAAGYPTPESVDEFYRELLRRVGEIPGVRSAAAVRRLPLATEMGDAGFRPVDYQPQQNEATQADWQWATPGYLETMGVPLIEGRTLDERDARGAPEVVVVNQTVARRFWGDRSPVGSRVLAGGGDTATVVGVVGDLRHNGITNEAKTRYYRPLAQVSSSWLGTMRGMTLTIGTEDDPMRYAEPVRAVIREMDPALPVAQVQSMEDVVDAALAQPRFGMTLLAAFAVLALTLAVVGIYGVLAYAVSQRRREIGIRLALGAEGGQVVGLVVREGMLMATLGVVGGGLVAWFATDLMAGLLYGVAPRDPLTFLIVPALFVSVALGASWLPALRAARVRPASTLRQE